MNDQNQAHTTPTRPSPSPDYVNRQHQGMQERLLSLYDYMVEFQLTHHVPVTANQLRLKFSVAPGTMSAWIAELKGRGLIKNVMGYLIVDGIEYQDVRNK